MKDKGIIIGIIAFVGILAGAYLYKGGINPTSTQSATNQGGQAAKPVLGAQNSNAREFRVSGKNFSFTPSQIRVKQGDTVRIVFDNTVGFHDLRVEGYNVGTKQIYEGNSETVEFKADKIGSFAYYCSVGSHRQSGMQGTLIVE